jgi:hypothetical protein
MDVIDFAFILLYVKCSIGGGGNTAGIIPAVFQPF